jgi:D-alanyl-D-alanine carboxypeptidase/D-alanyl-D-alanine-endopeptidase (penicillin-binding protein 4)
MGFISFINISRILFPTFIIFCIFFNQHSFATGVQKSILPVPRPIFFESFKPKLFDTILNEKKLEADIGFILYDIEDSKILETINPSKQYPLASITKLVTALYAMEILGPGQVFTTTIEAIGEENGGIIDGNLILRGGSDPTLSNDDLVMLVDNLWDNGLRKVDGKFIVDSSDAIYHREIDLDQPEYLSYNPSISGLNLNFNRVLFEWDEMNGLYSFQLQARSAINNFDVSTTKVNFSKSKHQFKDNNYNGKNDTWFFDHSFLEKAKKRWLPVRNPDNYAAELFWKIADKKGIDLPKPEIRHYSAKGKVLAKVESETLFKNIQLMLKYSNNLLSEVVGLSATKKFSGDNREIKVSAKIMGSWLENKIGNYEGNFSDHSGLGVGSMMSSHELIRFLKNSEWQASAINLMQSFKVKKTQSSTLKSYTNFIKAKTGTLNYVGNMAGYIETKSGRKLLYVILGSNLEKRNRLIKSDRDNPPEAKIWNKKIRSLQLDLIESWALRYN